MKRDVAQRAAADAEHDQVFGRVPQFRNECVYRADVFGSHGIKRKRSPTLPAGSFGIVKAVREIGDPGRGIFDRIWIEPMFADAIAEAVGVVQSQAGHRGRIADA